VVSALILQNTSGKHMHQYHHYRCWSLCNFIYRLIGQSAKSLVSYITTVYSDHVKHCFICVKKSNTWQLQGCMRDYIILSCQDVHGHLIYNANLASAESIIKFSVFVPNCAWLHCKPCPLVQPCNFYFKCWLIDLLLKKPRGGTTWHCYCEVVFIV